jgi:hypothetical protein
MDVDRVGCGKLGSCEIDVHGLTVGNKGCQSRWSNICRRSTSGRNARSRSSSTSGRHSKTTPD